jgi:hypothetical protein
MLAALDQELAEVVDMDPEVRKQCVSRAKSATGAKNKSHNTQQSTSTDVAKQMQVIGSSSQPSSTNNLPV